LYHDTLYASNLPYWLLDRISSQVAVLRSRTCFWAKDGYFGGWEGCDANEGCCPGNCNHVWHYAQAHARLFPAIARRMREEEFRCQKADGAIPHRQWQRGNTPNIDTQWRIFDGQCGAVLNSYREHLTGRDGRWLDKHWPGIKKAMDFIIANWDKDEVGVLAGPQWNTLDSPLSGSSSWLGSLYLAALASAGKWGLLQNEPDVAKRYARIFASGSKKQDPTLFNGEYYIQIRDRVPQRDYGNGCHIDQVLGQWWAHQLDLGWVYPPDHVRSALASLLKYNFKRDFHGVNQGERKFVVDDDAGVQICTWPKGNDGRNGMPYARMVMGGFEYAAAAAMIQAGLLPEGLTVVHAAWKRYDGCLRTGLTKGYKGFNAWEDFSGNPFGDDECGKFYARAMSTWSLLLACQGFVYDGPAGKIGFRPVWQPENHVSMFTAAEGWGLYTQRRTDNQQTGRIEIREGWLRLAELVFQLPEQAQAKSVMVRLGGKTIGATLTASANEVRLTLKKPQMIEAGNLLEVTIRY
jgi:uncharacterized protein (DUF608 family)